MVWSSYLDNVPFSNAAPGGHSDIIPIQLLHGCSDRQHQSEKTVNGNITLKAFVYIIPPFIHIAQSCLHTNYIHFT